MITVTSTPATASTYFSRTSFTLGTSPIASFDATCSNCPTPLLSAIPCLQTTQSTGNSFIGSSSPSRYLSTRADPIVGLWQRDTRRSSIPSTSAPCSTSIRVASRFPCPATSYKARLLLRLLYSASLRCSAIREARLWRAWFAGSDCSSVYPGCTSKDGSVSRRFFITSVLLASRILRWRAGDVFVKISYICAGSCCDQPLDSYRVSVPCGPLQRPHGPL